MSSPRDAQPCEGIVELNQRSVGPIRLPEKQRDDFLKHFNEVYFDIGLQIAPNPAYVMAPSVPIPAAVSVVSIGPLVSGGTGSVTGTMPITQQRNSFVDHLAGTLKEAFQGPERYAYFTDQNPAGGLISKLHSLSLEQATSESNGQSIAAHVYHLTFAMDAAARAIRGDHSPVDWPMSWKLTIQEPQQWEALKHQIVSAFRCLLDSIRALDTQRDECVGIAIGAIAHVAYHVGAIRQKEIASRK